MPNRKKDFNYTKSGRIKRRRVKANVDAAMNATLNLNAKIVNKEVPSLVDNNIGNLNQNMEFLDHEQENLRDLNEGSNEGDFFQESLREDNEEQEEDYADDDLFF